MSTPVDRRRFLKVTAVTGTTAALSACGNPENQIVRFIPDDELTPGIAEWKPSHCPLCSAGCGVLARVMDGEIEVVREGTAGVVRRALVKKLEGDPAHPISQGRLCVRGQAALQVTYHPDRLTGPMKRAGDRGSGQFSAISWDEAIDTLVERLRAASGGVGYLTRRRPGRREALVDAWLRHLSAPPRIEFEPLDDQVLRRANGLSFGRPQLPTFDLARTQHVINFGADVLGTWNSPLSHAVAYGAMRAGRQARLIQVEPRVSQTGASADTWVAIRPGTEGALALGLAHVLMASNLRSAGAAGRAGAIVEGWNAGLPEFAPAAVEALTGVPAARVERLARDLATHAPAVVVIGGAALAHTNGLAQALAVNALNALLGSVDVEGGVRFTPVASTASSNGGDRATPAPRSLREALMAPPPQVLVIDHANPIHGTAPGWKVPDWLRQIPFVASVGAFRDDTSEHADLLLPDSSFLESWTESAPESGAISAAATSHPPVMRPLHDTRPTPDVLLDVARRLALPASGSLPPSFETWLQASPVSDEASRASRATRADVAPSPPVSWTPPAFDGAASDYPFHFQPYASQALGDGSTAHLPWLQELPDPLTTAMWSSWVELHPAAADRLGVRDGDIVDVTSAYGTVQAPVLVSPGIAPDAVAMPFGQGHGTFTRYASGRGANAFAVLAPTTEPTVGSLAWSATRVKVTRVADADGRLIRFGGATRERPEHTRGRG